LRFPCIYAVGICAGIAAAAVYTVKIYSSSAAVAAVTFSEYLRAFDKVYDDPDEYRRRKMIFESRLRLLQAAETTKGRTWSVGVGPFTDLTDEERAAYLGYVGRPSTRARKPMVLAAGFKAAALPKSIDWRAHSPSVVTPVKSQGGCGGCWAFAAVEVLESRLALATGKLARLSPQELISCTDNPQHCGGNGGCTGSTPEIAFDYIRMHGLADEDHYPYVGSTGVCSAKTQFAIGVGETEYVAVEVNSSQALLEAVAEGPVAVALDASSWGDYTGGVWTGCDQINPVLNHAVVVEGYGVSAGGLPYWLIRNSWGTRWGEQGYIRLQRRMELPNICGVDTKTELGFGCGDHPPPITVCGECGILADPVYVRWKPSMTQVE
jgi:cathepsin L